MGWLLELAIGLNWHIKPRRYRPVSIRSVRPYSDSPVHSAIKSGYRKKRLFWENFYDRITIMMLFSMCQKIWWWCDPFITVIIKWFIKLPIRQLLVIHIHIAIANVQTSQLQSFFWAIRGTSILLLYYVQVDSKLKVCNATQHLATKLYHVCRKSNFSTSAF